MSIEYNLHTDGPYKGDDVLRLASNDLFMSFIKSLTPYLESNGDISKALANFKIKEAVMLLMQTNPALKDVLFDFTEPGKIDLEAYMNQHYKFNVDLDRFAYRQEPCYF